MSKTIPSGIAKKIEQLKKIETDQGVLPPEEWNMVSLGKKINDPKIQSQQEDLGIQSEQLFFEICEDLSELNFSPQEIATALNAVLRYDGGPRYCSPEEVEEALGS